MTGPKVALPILLLAAAWAAHGQGGTGLRFDPFLVPDLSPPPKPPPAVQTFAPAAPAVWNPTLRAVMVAGRSSAVNVGGEMVRLGEELDGYRLVEVTERRAVFERQGTLYELVMQ